MSRIFEVVLLLQEGLWLCLALVLMLGFWFGNVGDRDRVGICLFLHFGPSLVNGVLLQSKWAVMNDDVNYSATSLVAPSNE